MNFPQRLSLLLLLVACTGVRAQIVNIEDKRKTIDSIGWVGQLDVNGSVTKNNTKVLTSGASLRLDRRGRKTNVLFLSDYRLVRVSGDNALNAGFVHLRVGYEPVDGWRWEGFTQVQYDEKLRLTLRSLTGAGIRRRLYREGKSRAYLGILYMYEYDELADSHLLYYDHRLSNYFTVNVRLSDQVRVANTTYYQPKLPDFTVPRISSIANVEVLLSTHLRFTTSFSLTHDARMNRDLPDVPATTYKWANGLRLVF